MDDSAEDWTKAHRLAVAGVLAPHLRDDDRAKHRRVARVDADGNVVGYTTLAEVQKKLLERVHIEFDVTDGTRPKKLVCGRCGHVHEPSAKGKVKRGACPKCHAQTCADCGGAISRTAAYQHNKTLRCVECAGKARQRPIAKCIDCAAELAHKEPLPGSKPKAVRCKACALKARQKPLPLCAMCGKALSQSARVQPIRHCRDCFRKDPAFAEKIKASLAKATRGRWKKHNAKKKRSSPKGGVDGT